MSQAGKLWDETGGPIGRIYTRLEFSGQNKKNVRTKTQSVFTQYSISIQCSSAQVNLKLRMYICKVFCTNTKKLKRFPKQEKFAEIKFAGASAYF